ncbi:MAG TPA: phospholipase D-like domain-containing protein [Smithella sp.]|nr:phospholipase D-like domain-containing protein [Smithella sp.]
MSYLVDGRHIRLITERTVEHFLQRLFLRSMPMRSLCLVSPFINTLEGSTYTLADLSKKISREQIPTYVVTRSPVETYQQEAMEILTKNEWVEIRYNDSIHAKVYVAAAIQESESFALFGSGNLTGRSIASNIEVGMIIVAQGQGRPLVEELYYWANNRLRVMEESKLYQPIRARRKKK